MKFSIIATILFSTFAVNAQQLNVIQVKGNRAIVEVQTGEKLKVGESYSVGKLTEKFLLIRLPREKALEIISSD
jgi:hypothetical protein